MYIFTEKYPQIKKLFGVDPMFKWKVIALVMVQFVVLPFISQQNWLHILLIGYSFGGVINHALMLGKELVCKQVTVEDFIKSYLIKLNVDDREMFQYIFSMYIVIR